MIERKFVNQNIKEFEIKEYIGTHLNRVGLSDVKLQRTPLGEKIIITTSRPGLVVGRSGTNITKLTKDLKEVFKLENPQIEIEEVTNIGFDANIIAEMIANSLERFGTTRFKGIGHKAMMDVMGAGAFGVEILISGKVPSSRAKTWRFYQGYLKKCGDVAVSKVRVAYTVAKLKSGTLGIKVSIMTPDIELPDKIGLIKEEIVEKIGEVENKEIQKEMQEKIGELEVSETKTEGSESEDKMEVEEAKTRLPKKEAKKKKDQIKKHDQLKEKEKKKEKVNEKEKDSEPQAELEEKENPEEKESLDKPAEK